MKKEKIFLSLLILQIISFSIFSRVLYLPLLILSFSLWGYVRKHKLPAFMIRKIIIFAAFLFLIQYYFFPYRIQSGFNRYSLTFSLAGFSLFAQAFFLHAAEFPSEYIPLLSVIVILHSGNVYHYGNPNRVFQFFSLFYFILLSMFTSSSDQVCPGRSRFYRLRLLLLFLMTISAILLSRLVYYNSAEIEKFLTSGVSGVRFRFNSICSLNTMTYIREGDSDRIAVRIFSDNPPGYLRGVCYALYSEGNWRVTGTVDTLNPSGNNFQENMNFFKIFPGDFFETHEMDVWPERSIEDGLLCPYETVALKGPFSSVTVDENGIIDSPDSGNGRYTLYTGTVSELNLSRKYQDELSSVPDELRKSLSQLAEQITENCHTPREKALAITKYLVRNYRYGLSLELPGKIDPIVYFLEQKPAAHCEYFASAAAVLLRISGVLCRYCTGFIAVEYNPYGKYWVSRNAHAHAWVEAFDPETGFFIVEATPSDEVPGNSRPGLIAELTDHIIFYFKIITDINLKNIATLIFNAVNSFGMKTFIRIFVFAAALLVIISFLKLRYHKKRKDFQYYHKLHLLLKKADALVKTAGFWRKKSETIIKFSERLEKSSSSWDKISQWYKMYSEIRFQEKLSSDQKSCEMLKKNLEEIKKGPFKKTPSEK